MREMRWSWRELQDTPMYVRRFTWDCITAKREAEEEQQRRQYRSNEGVTRIRR